MIAAALWPGRRETGVVDHEEPVLGSPTSVRFRTLEVGVCGTDEELCSFHYPARTPPGSGYLVPGHEALGEVEEVGPAVTGLRPGDLVVPSVRRPCPRPDCPACRSGHQDYCTTGEFTERGLAGAHGFLAERVVEEEEHLFRVPPALRGVGVLTEPLTIAEKGLRQYLAVQRRLPWLRDAAEGELLAGTRAVVLGAGPVGILGCMLLRARGCEVSVYSREPESSPRAALVGSTGARYLSSADATVAALAAEVGRAELAYEAAGSPALAFETLGHLSRNGVLVLTGVPRGGGSIELPGDSLMTGIVVKNAILVGTVNAGREDFRAAIADLERFHRAWPDALRGIVTGRHRVGDFCRCATEKSGIKEVIDLSLPG
jgi:glucose 1-dehydrogenase